jgi:glycosyltransferase involved in cell wall biosynthesis
MINDISPLRGDGWYPARTRLRLRAAFARQVPRARVIVTVSEFCKQEILTEFPLDPDRVFVVPNTIEPPRTLTGDERTECAAWLRAHGVDRPFVLYLGNLHPRKNVPRLVVGFARAAAADADVAGCQLVIAGGRWWGGGEDRAMAAAAPGSVVLVGQVSDVQREYLLGGARALAYLSVYEGFGLPPVEAMARGVPVLASDGTAIPEVTAGAARLVDPLDIDAIAAGLVAVVGDEAIREELVRRGRTRAAELSVANTGRHALAALRAASG